MWGENTAGEHRSTKPGTTDTAAHSCGKMIAAHRLSAQAPFPPFPSRPSGTRGERPEERGGEGGRGWTMSGCTTSGLREVAAGERDGEMPAPDSLIAAAQLCVPL